MSTRGRGAGFPAIVCSALSSGVLLLQRLVFDMAASVRRPKWRFWRYVSRCLSLRRSCPSPRWASRSGLTETSGVPAPQSGADSSVSLDYAGGCALVRVAFETTGNCTFPVQAKELRRVPSVWTCHPGCLKDLLADDLIQAMMKADNIDSVSLEGQNERNGLLVRISRHMTNVAGTNQELGTSRCPSVPDPARLRPTATQGGNMLISRRIVALQTLHLRLMRTRRPFRYFRPKW
jgi:hypothetical protein